MLEVGVKTDQTNGTYFLFGKDLQNLEFHNQKCFLRIKLFGAVLGFQQRGYCIMSLWLRNILKLSYSVRTLRSWSKKIPALGIHVIKAYTEFQQYPCIISEEHFTERHFPFLWCDVQVCSAMVMRL